MPFLKSTYISKNVVKIDLSVYHYLERFDNLPTHPSKNLPAKQFDCFAIIECDFLTEDVIQFRKRCRVFW